MFICQNEGVLVALCYLFKLNRNTLNSAAHVDVKVVKVKLAQLTYLPLPLYIYFQLKLVFDL